MKKKYQIIYADPPWGYSDKRTGKKMSGGATNHYPTMTMPELYHMNDFINDLADDNCMLFMWATFPNMPQALDLIKAWGFKYKTLGFSWIKTNKLNGKPFFGIGWYTKSNCEVCLIAVKGRPQKVSNAVSSVVFAPKEEHSKKPDCVRDKIVEFVGNVPRIELFARQKTEGWDVWGNEVKNDIELKSIVS